MTKTTITKVEKTNEERLVDAAIRCIKKKGASKTYIEDIAREAGLSRPTAYRAVKSRKHLLQLVALRSVQSLTTTMKQRFREYKSFTDILIFGTIESMRRTREDKFYMEVMSALGDEGLERYLLDTTGPVNKYVLEAWRETIDLGRASGLLRSELTDYDITTLINSMNCIILLRDDLTEENQEDFLRKFLLPCLMQANSYDSSH